MDKIDQDVRDKIIEALREDLEYVEAAIGWMKELKGAVSYIRLLEPKDIKNSRGDIC